MAVAQARRPWLPNPLGFGPPLWAARPAASVAQVHDAEVKLKGIRQKMHEHHNTRKADHESGLYEL